MIACSVALLDDALFLVVVGAAAIVALVAHGVSQLLDAAGPSRR